MLIVLRIFITFPLISFLYHVMSSDPNSFIMSALFGIGLASIPFYIMETFSEKHNFKLC